MRHHDRHYRQLFGHPDVVRALLQGMLPPEWVALLDLDTLLPLPSDHVSSAQQARQGDLLWTVRRTDSEVLYFMLLLEHQARGDWLMPVRVLSYTGLGYETLVRRKLTPPGNPLPAILPIVLYSGLKPWKHAQDIASLLQPVSASLRPFQPTMQYLLIDEGKWVRSGHLPEDNLAAQLFKLEHNQGIEHTGRLLQTLTQQLASEPNRELYRIVGQWVRHILLPRALPRHIPLPDSEDLKEITAMTTTLHHSRDWTLKYRLEGKQEGRQDGQADLLARLIARKFGALPDTDRKRLASATSTQLEAWSLNILDAERIEDVFRD
ncbi:Rpn family recombination-promoting nuclease/putative transposase [Alcaligenaceae bacterium]|nr:Rpn family recombination-promoting nuclease/putative transposase [Alcaligenaceae bacterium]